MDENSLVTVTSGEYIAVKQLPIIEDRLAELHQELQGELNAVRNLAPTEENYKELKKTRAEWNKKIEILEKLRKKVKGEIEAPYKQFEKGPYADLVNDILDAVGQLDDGIKDVENIMKTDKQKKLLAYYEEYRQSLGLDEKLGDPRRSGIKVGLSDTLKGLKEQAKAHLDRIANDLKTIATLENCDEIMAEYVISLDMSNAIQIVKDRIAREEAARKAREEAEAARKAREEHEASVAAALAEAEAQEATEMPHEAQEASDVSLSPPSAEKLPEEAGERQDEILKVTYLKYDIYGTIDQLRGMKAAMIESMIGYCEQEGMRYGKCE